MQVQALVDQQEILEASQKEIKNQKDIFIEDENMSI